MVLVVIVGNGAREHAIARSLVEGGARLKAFMGSNNPGIAKLAKDNVKISNLTNFKELVEFSKDADFVVVGPEAPLVVGAANALKSAGISCIGPSIEAAQLEGSKIFTRELLQNYNIRSNIEFQAFNAIDNVETWVEKLGLENVVVKPDGLTGGKGVKVFGEHLHSKSELFDYCHQLLDSHSGFVIEEKLNGEEFTLQTFVDGSNVTPTPLVQDHKRAYEGDEGPNTGGMGSYSMTNHVMPFITHEDVKFALSEMKQTISALKKETGAIYKGFLYGQFMKTKKGIKLVEYNVRFGDPEAMNVLSIMESNMVALCFQILEGTLPDDLRFKKAATVCKYIVPEGYPTNPVKNQPIQVDEKSLDELGILYYYASVDKRGEKVVTTGSRTMGLLGIGSSLNEAEKKAELATQFVKGPLYHRKDIGTQELLEKRIAHMKKVIK
ncbi:MAG: phosphoribosylamine--glycine ligase [Candidatus Lokiarchaeota archaeon]|nr:phosphoribosylamine--glycine ligase [Candidatus Lokiarchaeota archaeon]